MPSVFGKKTLDVTSLTNYRSQFLFLLFLCSTTLIYLLTFESICYFYHIKNTAGAKKIVTTIAW